MVIIKIQSHWRGHKVRSDLKKNDEGENSGNNSKYFEGDSKETINDQTSIFNYFSYNSIIFF